ncbi:MAG: hypothetical protein EPO24_03625 [Bacteroidetes bacterium]|nr:MAG: hypothetical protein EPO24_03625 [Bacteroidota bacterium]
MKALFFFVIFAVQLTFSQSIQPMFSRLSTEPTQSVPEAKFQEIEFTGKEGKKSVAAAVALSLLLPGLGEWYAGDYSSGKYLSMAEGGLWLTWASFRLYGDWIQNDARTYAVQHAGITTDNKDDQYFIDIGNFVSVDAYNEQVLRDRDDDKVYDANSHYNWNWDTDNNREQYRQLRVQSDKVYNNANFVIAAIIVNHVISGINAARTATKHNNAIDETGGLNFQASPLGTLAAPSGIILTATYQF